MKGTLKKTEAGWVVGYISPSVDIVFIPLHPEDCWWSTNIDGLAVDFEIIRGEQIDSTDQQQWQEMSGAEKDEYFEKVAKLIKKETWSDIFEKCKYVTDSQSMTRGIIDWLSRNYKVPEQI